MAAVVAGGAERDVVRFLAVVRVDAHLRSQGSAGCTPVCDAASHSYSNNGCAAYVE